MPFTDGTAEDPLRRALEEAARLGPVKMVYLETPANPTNAMIDLTLARATIDPWAKTSGQTPLVVCDNTMLGPVFQTPLALIDELPAEGVGKELAACAAIVRRKAAAPAPCSPDLVDLLAAGRPAAGR